MAPPLASHAWSEARIVTHADPGRVLCPTGMQDAGPVIPEAPLATKRVVGPPTGGVRAPPPPQKVYR